MVMVTWCSASGSELQSPSCCERCAGWCGGRADGVIEVRELERISKEEDRCIIADQVPSSPPRCRTSSRSRGYRARRRPPRARRHRREASEHLGLFADLGEDLGLGKTGDVVSYSEGAVRARALGVHTALGDHLPIEWASFSRNQMSWSSAGPPGSGGHHVLVCQRRAHRRWWSSFFSVISLSFPCLVTAWVSW